MLVFEQVTKQFAEDSFGVKDISFEVVPGEFLFVTGPSGSGKTTLMRLLTKEYTPTAGDITFEEFNVGTLKNSQIHKLRRRIGVVFQDYRLLNDLNAWENIALPLAIIGKKQHEIEERVTDLLKLVELPDKAMLFPRQLSGGEAQRISIARALATGPSIIFADEPTGNLDEQSSLKIARLLHKINDFGTTVVFATHDPHVLDEFKGLRTLHMENGELTKDSGKKKISKNATKPAVAEEDKTIVEPENKEEASEEKTEAETKESKPQPEEKSKKKKPAKEDKSSTDKEEKKDKED